MNRKKAAAAVILDTRPKMDASTYTRHTRVVAAANVYAPTKKVVGNINDMITRVGRDNNAVKAGVQVTLATGQGGRVPAGSTFSDYAAGRAAEMDYKNGPPLGKVTLNSNDAGSLSGCNMSQAPFSFPSGTITAAAYNSTTGVVTFTAQNNYVLGEAVTVSGITGAGTDLNTVFNVTNAVITSVSSTQFTVTVATGLVAVAGASFTPTSAAITGTNTITYTGSAALFTGFTTSSNVITKDFTPAAYNIPSTGTTPSNPATVAGDFSSFTFSGSGLTNGNASVVGTVINTSLPTSGTSSVSRISNPNRTYPSGLTKYLVNNPELTVAKNASNNTKDILSCKEYTAEPHTDTNTPVQKGIHRFVDDTISLNSGTYRIGTGSYGSTGSTVGSSNSIVGVGADGLAGGCPTAIHAYPEVRRRAAWQARPSKGAGGLFNPVVPSQDHPRKVGGIDPSDFHKFVGKHHGNDFNVNPRRYPQTPFRIPAGTPAHLKINDEHRGI